MSLVEIEKQISPLSHTEKIRLIQDIAEMLRQTPDNELLHCTEKAGEVAPQFSGPLEAYEAARQLQNLLRKECLPTFALRTQIQAV